MKNYSRIIFAGTSGVVVTKLMGFGSFTVLGFGSFIITFLCVSLLWRLFEQKITFNAKKIGLGVAVFLTLVMSSGYFILWQYQNTTPVNNTILGDYRGLNKLYSEVFQFHPLLTNYQYKKLRYQFTEHLIPFSLTDDEKQQIWQNHLKLYVLQTNIRNILITIKVDMLGDKLSYNYEYDYAKAQVTPFHINSFITTFNNHNEGASIPSEYDKKPTKIAQFKDYGIVVKANLPYFNNSIPIHKKHINKIKLIHKMNKLSAEIMRLNQRLASK